MARPLRPDAPPLPVLVGVWKIVEGLQASAKHAVLAGVLLAGLEIRHHLRHAAAVVIGGRSDEHTSDLQ